LVAGLQCLRNIFEQSAFRDLKTKAEYLPGNQIQSETELMQFARTKGGTVFHPSGTCRMGSDSSAVLDTHLRVRGVSRLRVIDASAMPRIPSTNINAATIMIAEKAAHSILSGN
jgi:choline dehydrogenase